MTKLQELQDYFDNSEIISFHASTRDWSGISWKRGGLIIYNECQNGGLDILNMKYIVETLPEEIAFELLESFKRVDDQPDLKVLGGSRSIQLGEFF